MTGNKILISEVKGIKKLEFELPPPGVHVITAGNGSGKTTLLVCIERIKNKSAFRDNFWQQKFWNVDSYDQSSITYSSKAGNSVTYTYRRKSDSWRPVKRGIDAIHEFGYNDIVAIPPLGKRVYVQTKKLQKGKTKAASDVLRKSMSRVLENDKFLKLLKVNLGETRGRGGASRRNNTAFLLASGTIRSNNKTTTKYYSEISFSLGEIFALNLLFELEVIKDGSLLVIDELEVALHPRVQINLLHYIEEKAKQKNLTVIISTHSSSLIKCAKSLIYLEKYDNNLIKAHYNCYPAIALREISVSEDILPDYVFFVEDHMAELLLREIIKYFFHTTRQRQPIWKVLPIGGYPEVLRFIKAVDSYVLHKKIGQYAFLDNDVKSVFEKLSAKGNNRTKAENDTWQLFQSQRLKVKYLDVTPELGLWLWIKDNINDFQSSLNSYYSDANIDLKDLVRKCEASFPSRAQNPRDDAKKKTGWCAKEIANCTNDDENKVQQALMAVFVESFYANEQNQNNLKGMFCPVFNKRGN